MPSKEMIAAVMSEAAKSNIEKRKVGCVIVKNNAIIGYGHNTERHHAEVNAINHAVMQCGSEDTIIGAHAYVSHPPCPECAQSLIKAGIEHYEVVEEFIKFDGDKIRPDLIPVSTLIALSEVLTFGARKYKPNNWKECKDLSRYEAAFMRHYIAWKQGETIDIESGMPHLWHMLTNITFLVELDNDNV